MSSNPVIIPITNGQLSSTHTNRKNFYSSSSSNLSHSSSSSSKSPGNTSINFNHRKDSTLKLPYPVLSDHRDPSSILILLQKETQTTSKKIANIIKQIDECERHLILNHYTDNEKKTFKYERVKFKQQLDGLKKHERRVRLQIDFMTTKNEIKGLEDESNSNENQQIKIVLGKLKQKLDKMKIYMRTRNEQMKKMTNINTSIDKRKSTSIEKDVNRKRSSTSTNNSHLNKRVKSTAPVIRLTSRVTSHQSNKHAIQPPIVRFIDKTTNVKINSASPTTPASSSSTSSPPLTKMSKTKNSLRQRKIPLVDDEDGEPDLEELDMDELFNDDAYSEQRFQVEIDAFTRQHQVKQNT